MAKERILRRGLRDEVKRTVHREAEARYRHELLSEEERLELRERIFNLKKELAATAR